jgi:DNA invertase Pin-like site-specific DNA recombinase
MTANEFSIKPTNVYIYIRVSTKRQTYKSNGLEEQCKLCQDYLKKYFPTHLSSVKYYTDIGSSYNEKNTLVKLNKLMRDLSLYKNSLILVRDISRLGRNTFQVFSLLRRIKKANSHIISIDENLCWNYSRLMDRKFSHIAIDSEENSDNKSIKSKNRIKLIKSKGGHIGGIPFGTRIIKKNNIPYIYKNPDEINTLKTIKTIFLKYLSVEKTATYLNNLNMKKRNTKWSNRQISNVLKKFFPNVISNKKSDLVDIYFTKYRDYNVELENDITKVSDRLDNMNLNTNNTNNTNNTKPKRKYIKIIV